MRRSQVVLLMKLIVMRKDNVRKRKEMKRQTDLLDLKNCHVGEKCFVIGSGPSVAFLDLSDIHQHIVICSNSSILLVPWQTKDDAADRRFWISNDSLCLQWSYFWTHVIRSCCTKLVRTSWRKYDDKIINYDFRYFAPRKSQIGETLDDDGSLCYVSSVPSSIDLAIWMGCKKVYLLGVDHKMTHGNSHFWQFWSRDKWPERKDKHKFFRPEQKHQVKKFKENVIVFNTLKSYAKSKGVSINNCSHRSAIDIFDYKSLDQSLKE